MSSHSLMLKLISISHHKPHVFQKALVFSQLMKKCGLSSDWLSSHASSIMSCQVTFHAMPYVISCYICDMSCYVIMFHVMSYHVCQMAHVICHAILCQ